MSILRKLVIGLSLFLVSIFWTNAALAEYYIVYNGPCPTYQCYQPAPVREIVYYPIYKKHKKHVYHKHKKHHYASRVKVKRSTASVSVYYYWQVYPNPCPCSSCGCGVAYYYPAPVVYNETYITESTCSSLDRATADDNPGCYPGMNIDN